MIRSFLFPAALLALALTPDLAPAQFRSFVRPPGVGPIVPWRPTPVFARPTRYYTAYDPLGYNYSLNRMYWSPYSYPRLYGGVYGWGATPLYVPLYAGSTLFDTYQPGYSPAGTALGGGTVVSPTAELPKPRVTTASLEIAVADPNAELWFNGVKTQQTGTKRTFTTPELAPGKVYSYEIRARWMEKGQEYDQTRTVTVQPGAQVVFAFFAGAKEQLPPPVEKN